ncbi:MAG TPA: methyltransferase [Candidatus Angelobacter sp.]|nr:methyltransferase [Candidatus Angelobacter sp.]
MTTANADDATKIFSGSSRARTIGRAATLATVLGAVFALASMIKGWNWSEISVVFPYVVFEGGVAVFGLVQGPAKAWASWSDSRGGEIFLPILGTWLYPVVVLYGPTAGLPSLVFVAIYLWLAWSILSLRTNFSVLPEARVMAKKGPYRIVRHPMYLGYCALWLAWAAEANGGIGPWLWATLGILLYVYRASVEEKKMRLYVPGYAEYCQQTPEFIPLPRPRRSAS